MTPVHLSYFLPWHQWGEAGSVPPASEIPMISLLLAFSGHIHVASISTQDTIGVICGKSKYLHKTKPSYRHPQIVSPQPFLPPPMTSPASLEIQFWMASCFPHRPKSGWKSLNVKFARIFLISFFLHPVLAFSWLHRKVLTAVTQSNWSSSRNVHVGITLWVSFPCNCLQDGSGSVWNKVYASRYSPPLIVHPTRQNVSSNRLVDPTHPPDSSTQLVEP